MPLVLGPFQRSCRFSIKIDIVGIFSCTGAVPDGADAVVQVENTELVKDASSHNLKRIRILKAVSNGHDIRPVV